jgi:S1-C subfamily serine protease
MSIFFGIITIPVMQKADGLSFDQMSQIGGENLWRIVIVYGLLTFCTTILVLWSKRFKLMALFLIMFWIAGTGLTAFINLSDNGSPKLGPIASCNEENSLEYAKKCSILVIADGQGHGTGFHIGDGNIVTARHVIEGASKLTTWWNGEEIPLNLWNYSDREDVAILKVNANIPECTWSDSTRVGLAETLFTVGWPNVSSGESSITKGIYSRTYVDPDGPIYIQTDAPINPGNSGGPLVNRCGIIGINTFKYTWSDPDTPSEGYGFALASNYAKASVDYLIKTGANKPTEDTLSLLLKKVGKLYNLPDEIPTVAVITDITLLGDQEFFDNGKNGDKVLIYSTAELAVLYRPSENKIIDVQPITINN